MCLPTRFSPEHLAVGDGPDDVRTLRVHDVHVEILRPAVLRKEFAVGVGVVAHAARGVAVSGVALDHRAFDFLHHRPPEFRTQEVLVAQFAGVHLDGHLARQLYAQFVIDGDHAFRRDLAGEVYLGFIMAGLLSRSAVDGAPGPGRRAAAEKFARFHCACG